MRRGKIGLTQTWALVLIGAAIALGVYLSQRPQTFTPKADLNVTTVQFVDKHGQAQTQTSSPLVKLKLTYIPSISGVYPTNFRVANDSPSNLTIADTQTFDQNDKVIDWVLSQGSGQKNVYVQFQVNGVWQDYLQASISESAPQATYQLSTKATTVSPGQSVTVNWNNSEGTPTDWIGLYQTTSPDSKYTDLIYTSCSKDKTTATRIILQGSCSFIIPSNASTGSYEFRMFSQGGLAQLAASGSFKVQ